MMSKVGPTKIVHFITPGAGVLVQRHDHIYHSEGLKKLKIRKQSSPHERS